MTKKIKLLLGFLTAFIALTAIPGGAAILLGLEDFPMEWLEGTPFRSYTIPALILIFIVGGCALWAAIALFTRQRSAAHLAMLAGLIMMGQIIGEVLLLKQEVTAHWIEYFYFLLGLLIFVLSLYPKLVNQGKNNHKQPNKRD